MRQPRIIISVDVEGTQASVGSLLGNHLQTTLELLDETGMPATWAVPGDGRDWVSSILDRNAPHEVALAATPSWAGNVNRTLFADQLQSRIREIAAQGARVETLVLPEGCSVDGRMDLLVKHRITTLRAPHLSRRQRDELGRFGVAIAPRSIDLHGSYAWWSGGPRAVARRALHEAIQQQAAAHLAIHLRRVVEQRREATALAVLRDAASRVRYGLAELATLNQIPRKHQVFRTGTGHSALRAA